MDEKEIKQLVTREREKFPYHQVYFTLKKLKMRHLVKKTVENFRTMLALVSLGLPITTYTLDFMNPTTCQNTSLYNLHNYGDRHLLTLRREHKKSYRWELSPLTKQAFGVM